MKLVTVSQMQAIEKEAYASGLSYEQMMENAGQGLADVMYELFEDEEQAEHIEEFESTFLGSRKDS